MRCELRVRSEQAHLICTAPFSLYCFPSHQHAFAFLRLQDPNQIYNTYE